MSFLKRAGLVILSIGIILLIVGILLFVMTNVGNGFWFVVISIIINVIAIMMITHKNTKV